VLGECGARLAWPEGDRALANLATRNGKLGHRDWEDGRILSG
jgi:hypothetical protein